MVTVVEHSQKDKGGAVLWHSVLWYCESLHSPSDSTQQAPNMPRRCTSALAYTRSPTVRRTVVGGAKHKAVRPNKHSVYKKHMPFYVAV